MKPDFRVAGRYALLLLPAAVFAIVVSMLGIRVANSVLRPFSPDGIAVALNAVPAILAGGLIYGIAARDRGAEARSRHIIRSAPLYCTALALGSLIALGWRDPGFRLVAQLFIWPLAAVIGGIIADAAVQPRRASVQ
jgi:hypothetical protein